jgi:hypothetical protein
MAFTYTHADIFLLTTPDEVRKKSSELQALGGTESEREERARRKAHIKEKILRGEMIPFRWSLGHVAVDGSVRRVNGQHSSEVFLELTPEEWADVTFPIVVIEEHFECDTPKDRAHLFEQYDPAWSSRSREDTIGPHLALQGDLAGMNRYAANHATQGLQWYFAKVVGDTKMAADARGQFELLYQNSNIHGFLQFCQSLGLNKRKTSEMASKPVIAAMFHTIMGGNSTAEEFWHRVSGGTGSILDADSYEYKLAEYLDLARDPRAEWSAQARTKFANRRKPHDVEIFATCLRLFAASHDGVRRVETIEKLRERTAKEVAERVWPLTGRRPAAARQAVPVL